MKYIFKKIIIFLAIIFIATLFIFGYLKKQPTTVPYTSLIPKTALVNPDKDGTITTPQTLLKKKINLVVGLWNQQDPDIPIIPARSEIENLIFKGSGNGQSVADYFSKMSGGSVELNNAGVFGWYPSKKYYTHYWADPDPTDADNDGYISGHNEKWAETILEIDKEFDFSAFDFNHDGNLTPDELGVLIVIPATGPFGTNRGVMSQEYPVVKPMVVDGVTIEQIAEFYTGIPPNFGAVAHELSHLFFNTADMYLDSNFRAGNFSLLDGSYCNCYIDPWQRLAMDKNWLNVKELTQSGNYELAPVNTSGTVMKIARPKTDEFLLLEYRQNDKYQDIGAPGLLVWDVLTTRTDGDWARNNIRLLRANGGVPLDDNLASYRAKEPNLDATGVIKWSDGSSSGVSLTEIGLAGVTIKFKLNLGL